MCSELTVVTLRTLPDRRCPHGAWCVGRHKLDGVPGSFVVLKVVQNADHLAALADRVAPDELIGWAPDELFAPYEATP